METRVEARDPYNTIYVYEDKFENCEDCINVEYWQLSGNQPSGFCLTVEEALKLSQHLREAADRVVAKNKVYEKHMEQFYEKRL